MTDLTKLKELAERATPGPWTADQLAVTADTRTQVCCSQAYMECCGDPDIDGDEFDPVCSATSEPLADFIAAANPAAVLDLIAEVERLRKDAERYRWLRSPQASYAVGMVFECGGSLLDERIDAALEGGGR